jgi:5-methylcytosine-specific restriction enzyme A
MTILRACVECGAPSRESYCPEHKPKPWGSSKRRERMGISGGAWETIRRRVLERDMGCCYLCDEADPPATQVDHLISVADGGTSRMDNCASCHPACHARKHREPEWASGPIEMALRVLAK